jgi:hypothetical protein
MHIENVIHIDAPPDVVWAATVDVERWPEWSPTVQSVQRVDQGPFDVGSTALIKQPGLPEAKWSVTALTPGERFTWETCVGGMRMIASHDMTATGSGTRNVLRIEVSGFVARLLWPFVRSSIRRALEQENAGLKNRCESAASQRLTSVPGGPFQSEP